MMLNIFNYLKRPEYLLRPRQALTRLARIGKPVPDSATVRLPWNASVTVHTCENVGRDIYFYGIFDKIVPEAIWRLLDKGETAVEIGANIGQNSSLMAARTGPNGRVLAFEPHPEIFEELKGNHERSQNSGLAPVKLERVALGEASGEATLIETEEFVQNRGSATLRSNTSAIPGFKVSVRRLDDFLGAADRVGVCKIDVEGHELSVLRGAEQSLARKAIRDIIFEDFNPKPSSVTEILARHGFSLFELHGAWLKPRLAPVARGEDAHRRGFAFNYLATLDPQRAKLRFQTVGWHCLTCRSSR
jgi:FkbM family methyltransferase